MSLCSVSMLANSNPSPPVWQQRAWYTTSINPLSPKKNPKKPKAILSACQDSRTITVKVSLITFLQVTMKKVLYQSLFPTLSTRAGVAVALLGLSRSYSKRYGVVPFCSSTFMQLLSSFSSPDEDCSKLLLELLLLCSSAMFSAFLRSPGWRHRAN